MHTKSVADAMHVGIHRADPGVSVVTLAALMAEHGIHCIVVDGLQAGPGGEQLVWGVVTDTDLLAALSSGTDAEAGQLAATEPVCIAEQAPLTEAMAVMVEHEVSHVIVVDAPDGRPTGILSTLDVARAAAAVGGTAIAS